MALKVEVEYIEVADEEERIQKVAKILAQGVYSYLKKEGPFAFQPVLLVLFFIFGQFINFIINLRKRIRAWPK